MKHKIQDYINERRALIAADGDEETVDAMAALIQAALRDHQESLPVEFILESLTSLGAAPSLIYDDNAHWTVGGDGHQSMIFDEDRSKETIFNAGWIVPPNRWRKSIREAVRDYLGTMGEP